MSIETESNSPEMQMSSLVQDLGRYCEENDIVMDSIGESNWLHLVEQGLVHDSDRVVMLRNETLEPLTQEQKSNLKSKINATIKQRYNFIEAEVIENEDGLILVRITKKIN